MTTTTRAQCLTRQGHGPSAAEFTKVRFMLWFTTKVRFMLWFTVSCARSGSWCRDTRLLSTSSCTFMRCLLHRAALRHVIYLQTGSAYPLPVPRRRYFCAKGARRGTQITPNPSEIPAPVLTFGSGSGSLVNNNSFIKGGIKPRDANSRTHTPQARAIDIV